MTQPLLLLLHVGLVSIQTYRILLYLELFIYRWIYVDFNGVLIMFSDPKNSDCPLKMPVQTQVRLDTRLLLFTEARLEESLKSLPSS